MENNQIPTTAIVLVIFAIVGLIMFLSILFFFVLLIRIAMRRREYDKQRGAEMAQNAAQIGFNFKPQTELNDVPVLANFDMFEGNVIKIENLMTGKINGKDVSLFDCVYMNVAAPGSGATTSRQTMAMIEDTRLNLPFFYLRPEGNLEKALNFIARMDIDIPQRPIFSQKYLLYGHEDQRDETTIRHTFNRALLLDYLEQNQAFCALANGKFLIIYQSRTLTPPAQVKAGLILCRILVIYLCINLNH